MKFYSPLRYPGGKGRLSLLMKEVLTENKIYDGTYIEPYAGGAAAAIQLLMDEYVWNVIINDIDPAVYAFWYCVLNDTEWLLRRIHDTPVTLDEWYQQKSVFSNADMYQKNELGFATFFLNRTNRSGILNGGMIGGKKQNGKYKIDARYNKENLSERIKDIARKKNRIKIFNLDAGLFLKKITRKINDNALFYFDPPYYEKGSLLYTNHYVHKDHSEMAKKIKKLNHPWIVTYDDVQPIADLYSDITSMRFALTYSAHLRRPRGTELMFFNGVQLPAHIRNMQLPYFSRHNVKDISQEAA